MSTFNLLTYISELLSTNNFVCTTYLWNLLEDSVHIAYTSSTVVVVLGARLGFVAFDILFTYISRRN